jgi:hypothetical protein
MLQGELFDIGAETETIPSSSHPFIIMGKMTPKEQNP